jgi:hypothetical protein
VTGDAIRKSPEKVKNSKKIPQLKNCGPAKGKATLDGPSGKVSTDSPLSMMAKKITEKSHA